MYLQACSCTELVYYTHTTTANPHSQCLLQTAELPVLFVLSQRIEPPTRDPRHGDCPAPSPILINIEDSTVETPLTTPIARQAGLQSSTMGHLVTLATWYVDALCSVNQHT